MNNIGFLLFMIITILGAFLAFGYFFIFQNNIIPKKAISCTNDGPTISFLIDEEERELIMMGEKIEPENVKIFNEAVISAQWELKDGYTKIFIDRISGELEVETKRKQGVAEKQKFKCLSTIIKF